MAALFDDVSVLPDHELWRRIPPWHFVADRNLGVVRVSSAAFEDDQDGDPMSVVLGTELRACGRQERSALPSGTEDFGMVWISAGLARERGQIVAPTPQPDEALHASVAGKKTKGVCNEFYKKSRWVFVPPGKTILGAKAMPSEWLKGVDEASAHQLLTPDPARPK
jgi:hypothetical protein